MIDEHEWAKLARYLAGECNPEEADEVRRWIAADPSRAEALAFMQQVDATARESQGEADTDASWMRLTARKGARERRVRTPLLAMGSPTAASSRWRRWAGRAAAAIVLAVGGSALWMWPARHAAPVASPLVTREYTTPRGQRATFHLPDGSSVMLGVASKLRYVEGAASSPTRDVQLDGEALFEVKHDAKRPFLVRTAHAVTQDIGTKFSIQAYGSDPTVRIVVAEGSVELKSDRLAPANRGVVLAAGQLGQLTPNGDALVRSGIDVARYLAWTEGRLILDDTPLRDALPQLERWYDLHFVLADSALAGRRITATLDGGDAIPQTLDLLSSSVDLVYHRRGRTVTLASPVPTN